MDTKIGKFNLTKNQILNLPIVSSAPFKGFSYWHDSGTMIGVSEAKPTQTDIDSATVAINALPDVIDKKILRGMFNVDFAKQEFYADFSSKLTPGIRAAWGVLSDMLIFKNFEGIKAYRDALLADGTLTPEDVTHINKIFTDQGIDLDNL
jgi:hypothetical protein